MKVLLFSDIHIHPYRPYSYDLDGMNSRLRWSLRALEYILQYAYDNDMMVVFLGDLFEDRKTLRMEAAVATIKIIREFVSIGGSFSAVPGNHDYYSRTENIWSLVLTHGIADQPKTLELGGKRVAVHPYPMEGYDKFKEFLANTEADYLFTHADMDVEKAGLDEHEIKVGATSIQLYKRFGHVFSGHYHWRQTVDNFTYLGNPLQKDFGDRGQDKGFHVLNLASGEAEFVPLPALFPRFERFTVTTPEGWNSVIEHRTRRGQDYLKISYDPALGIHKDLDVSTEPAPALERIRKPINIGGSRLEEVKGLAEDPVKAFVEYKKKNGVYVPPGSYTFAKEILAEAEK